MTRRVVPAGAALVALALLAAACGNGSDEAGDAAATSAPPVTSSTTTAVPTTSSPTPTATRTATATRKPTATRKATASPSTSATPKAVTSLAPVPRTGAQPTVRFPDNPPAVGSGANAVVYRVPDSVWSRMVGYSWTSGCPVGRSGLRYVEVNFWGFDGKRSRGALVVSSSIAQAAARAFSDLYDQQFRIRQMRPMDKSWGRNPKGPGADDYKAMDADNTSAFNCRYVGGQESSKVYSKHAYGTAIDVNDFENPYLADDGQIYPDAYYAHRRGPAPGVFSTSGSAAVRAFTRQGLGWGGLWSHPDYQHFQS
ncbi:hypothetical protein GCM10027446_31290 [Angustibacter peucedani]